VYKALVLLVDSRIDMRELFVYLPKGAESTRVFEAIVRVHTQVYLDNSHVR
jgi:hypothetical protein